MRIIKAVSIFHRATRIGYKSTEYEKVQHHTVQCGPVTAHSIGTEADAQRVMNTRVHALGVEELRRRGYI